MRKKLIVALAIALLFGALLPIIVFSSCPQLDYSPNELRGHIRSIIFNFLSNPGIHYGQDEVLDLLQFYKNEKRKSAVGNCDINGDKSGKKISAIMEKTIDFARECSDGVDNDHDGKVDLNDGNCADKKDEHEAD